MKKSILVLFLLIFIAPSVALASWWNPISWFNNWSFNKKEVAPKVQVDIQKTPEEKIEELQKQLDELKNKETNITPPVAQNIPTKSKNKNIKQQSVQTIDVCSNIAGIQATTPIDYSWSYGNICSLINLTDYCPNIIGVQSRIPDGMFIYGNNKECLTQNEINYIAEKMTEAKNKEITSNTKSNDPPFSKECEDAQDEYDRLYDDMNKIEDLSKRADFAILKVNPANSNVNSACKLKTTMPKLEPTKSTNCYVSYYGSSATVSCYSN